MLKAFLFILSEPEIQEWIEGAVGKISRGKKEYTDYEKGCEDISCPFGKLIRKSFHNGCRAYGSHGNYDGIAFEIIESFCSDKGCSVQTEHKPEAGKHLTHIFSVENSEAYQSYDYNIKMGNDRVLFESFTVQELFGDENYRIKNAPDDVVPACSVPEARQKPHYEYIEYMAGRGDSVSAEGDIYVVSEPGAEGHMPPSPEFCGTFGDKGIIEIFEKVEAEHSAETYSHITVTRKVEINLQCYRCGINPGENHRFFRGTVEGGTKGAYGVCQEYFFTEADSEFYYTRGELLRGMSAGFKLMLDVGISYDGACDKLGEKSDVAGKVDRVPLRR